MSDYLLAQSSVLGSMLISPAVVGDVMLELRPEDFTEPMGEQVFRAIRDLYLDGGKIDPVCVLNRMGPPDPARRKYLLALMDQTPTAANVREYMAIVREQSKLRGIQSVGLELATAGVTMERVRELAAQLERLLMDRRDVECLSMEQGLLNFQDEIARMPEYLPWGIDFLDEGLTAERSDYIVLGGYPSDGKTALALCLAYHQAKSRRVGFFSLETKNSKLFNRIYSAAAKVSGTRIKRRTLTQEDYLLLERTADELRHRDLHLVRSSSMTVEDIASYTRARRFDVIYIDYLTLVQAPGQKEYDQATYISKALHRLAQDSGVTVVALSQLSRPEGGKPKPPTMSSLRSSGQIEQDADIVMFIYREEPGNLRSRRILSVSKNKEGLTGRVPLLFNGETQTFRVDPNGAIRDLAKREPAYRQTAMYSIPGSEPVPWEEDEEEQDGPEQKEAAASAGGGGPAAPGAGQAGAGAGGAPSGDSPGPGDGPEDLEYTVPF